MRHRPAGRPQPEPLEAKRGDDERGDEKTGEGPRNRFGPSPRHASHGVSAIGGTPVSASFARSTACASIFRLFSLNRYVTFGAGIPWASVSSGSRVTVLVSSGRSSVMPSSDAVWS